MKKCLVSDKEGKASQDPEQKALSHSTVENFPCSHCSKNFSSLSNANRHEKFCSKNSTKETECIKCASCSKSFNRKDNLSAHMKKCSAGDNGVEPKKRKVSCLYDKCDFTCWTKTILIDHLRAVHDHTIKPVQVLNFKSESEFLAWKEAEEARTYSYFSQDCGLKGNRIYLYCQHDGPDVPHRKKGSEGRKTSRKHKIGQIKRGNVCLSKMIVVNHEDGLRTVEYYESHSHPLSKHDLAHQRISLSTYTFIKNQLAFNVPPREIFKTLQSTTSARENREISTTAARNLTITERRIRQRAARKRSNLRLHQNDAVSVRMLVDSLQQEKYNPVIIYKPMGDNVIVGPKENFEEQLLRDLFMCGLQTKEQRKLLVQYSSKVVIVDDTHNVTQYDNVKLFNMLITDENNKGWPVAHFISNCMAAKILKLFVQAIKVRCEEAGEVLSINCVISDDDAALINGIEEGMCKTIPHILCQWHLDNTFKDSIRLKAPRDMFDTIYTELKVIISERSTATFTTLYTAFLTRHSEDAPDFVKYLTDYYSQRTEKWAMCYREGLGHGNTNTSGHAESFHNRLKTGEFKRIPNKRMDDLINTLLALERRDFQERERLDILGYSEPPYKCKEKHERGMAMSDSSIAEIREDMWQIESATSKGQSYHIVRVQPSCHKDFCYDKCINPSCHGLCAHLFVCSCKDNVSLCKHVHKLQSFLLKDFPAPVFIENESSEVTFYTMDNNTDNTCEVSQSEFSEANAYARLEASLASLSNLVYQRAIPKHLLPLCDADISELVKKCTLLSIPADENLSLMPPSRKIAPKEKLATQYSQMLPFKRKRKDKKKKDLNRLANKNKKDAAKESLLAFSKETSPREIVEVSSGEESIEETGIEINESSPSLKDIALSIGPYRVTFLALKTIPLDLEQSEVQNLKALDKSFEKGWLTSDIINSFVYSLALTNESVYSGADELALSMARGNILSRLFGHELRDKSIFLFPANFSGNHWTMFAILTKKSQILYMDPKQGNNPPPPPVFKCIVTLKKIMKVVKPSVDTWTFQMVSYCNQTDNVNCGVHVCWFAHQTIMEVDYEDLQDIDSYRNFIYTTLRGNCLHSDNPSVCPLCSHEDSPSSMTDFSLHCGKCKQLYHISCLGERKSHQISEEDFVCPELVSV
jgi:hypothetical protein